jgi:DNA-binding NarL/FixJ family response regulator
MMSSTFSPVHSTAKVPVAYGRGEQKIRVGIIDDHPVFRLGLKALLSTQEDLELVLLAESGEAALLLLESQELDVLLIDLRMPGLSGSETLERVQKAGRSLRAIVVSSFQYDEEIYASVRAGAQGYVHKEADPKEILNAIREVARGKQAFPRHIAERLTGTGMTAGLSPREHEILQLVAVGLTNKEVAATLHISQFTVRNHLNHITRKLDASDRTEAIFLALKTGLISIS